MTRALLSHPPFVSTMSLFLVWLGTSTSYHASLCPAMLNGVHLCSYLIMFMVMMSHGFLLALQCFMVSHHVMSCSFLFYLVFLCVFLCNLMPFDASGCLLASTLGKLVGDCRTLYTVHFSFWVLKFSLGSMRSKMARLKWNLFKRTIMKSKN